MRKFLATAVISTFLFACQKEENIDTPEPISTLGDGLVAHYPLNGNANDVTTNQNNGTITGASSIADRFGNSNAAYVFNGTSNYIKINNSASLDLKESFSISTWISPDNYSSPGVVVWNGDAAFAKDPYILYFTNRPGYNALGVRKDAGSGLTINETFAPSNVIFSGIWSHVVVTCNAVTKQMKIYINGELKNTGTFADMSIGYSTTNFYTMIGAAESTAGIDNFFKGKVDEVRIYNREINQTEVTEIFKL